MLQTSNLAVLLIFPALFSSGTHKLPGLNLRVGRSCDQVLQRSFSVDLVILPQLKFSSTLFLNSVKSSGKKDRPPAGDQFGKCDMKCIWPYPDLVPGFGALARAPM